MTSAETTIEQIAADLRALGVRRGGVLLVHSSLRALGPLPGRAETAVRGLLAALGEGGTLLMPALSYETVRSANPVFDVQATPSCVGALTEYFRLRPGTRRSIHPTHSATARGARAAVLLAGHELDTTPVGPHSPFRKLRDADGQLLFLGCGLRPNTSMHGVEELVEPPYLYADELDYRILLSRPGGGGLTMRVRRHNFVGWEQRYDRLGPLMEGKGLRTGRVLAAAAHLLEAAPMWDAALAALHRDPLYFVDKVEI